MRNGTASILCTILFHHFLFIAHADSAPVVSFCATHESCESEFPTLKISFVNVGLGDATFIQCPDGKHQALIDAGDSSDNYPGAEEALDSFLSTQMKGDRTIELALNTHPHPDHVAGFLALVRAGKFQFKEFLDSGLDFKDSTIEEELRSLLKENKTSIVDLTETDRSSFVLCPSFLDITPISLEVLAPARSAAKTELGCPGNLNDCSVMSRVKFGGSSVVLLSDGGKATEQWLLSNPEALSFVRGDTIKFAHHGSRFASFPEFLSRLSPQLGIISHGVPHHGRSEELGYPDFETVNRLSRLLAASSTEQKSIVACQRTSTRELCNWQQVPTSSHLKSTAEGPITLFLFRDKQNSSRIVVK